MNLFNTGKFILASGQSNSFKIDCDALTEEDLKAVCLEMVDRLPFFHEAHGVPTGGVALARHFNMHSCYRFEGSGILIVDDVWTTGGSVNRFIDEKGFDREDLSCAVIFARGETPDWVYPLFRMEL